MSDPSITFTEQLVRDHPELAPMLAEHLDDNFGDLLPHLFMGDVTRYVVAQHLDAEADPAALESLLADLDRALTDGEGDVPELIAVSFVENLPYDDEDGGDVVARLGPALTAELESQRGD